MTGILFIVLACLLWGVDALIRYPLVERGINPVSIVFYEHAILTLIFSVSLFPAFKGIGEMRLSDLFSFFVIGGLGSAIATIAFTESFLYLNPSLVILLQKLQPVVAIILASLILKEQIQKRFLLWAGICLFGGILISSPDVERLYHLMKSDFRIVLSDNAIVGHGLVAISILGWGSATVFGKRLTMAGFDTKAIMGGRFLTGLIVIIPFVQWNQSMVFPETQDYVKVALMVLISGALAMYFYYKGLKRIPAKTAAIAEMFFPFFAIIANWIFLGKQLTELQLLGGGILVIGSLVIQLKKY
jgi:drug/metabolite transporter (DMT)-like permease